MARTSRTPRAPEVRVNKRIRAKEIRVVDSDGTQLGLLTVPEALKIAEEKGLDLVEVAPNSTPPVCRLMDFGKFKYDQKKQLSAKKSKVQSIKEVKFRPNIGSHDLNVKIARIKEFLVDGHKARIRIFFRGREITHPERGNELVHEIIRSVEEVGSVDSAPKLEGKNLIMVLSPGKKKVS